MFHRPRSESGSETSFVGLLFWLRIVSQSFGTLGRLHTIISCTVTGCLVLAVGEGGGAGITEDNIGILKSSYDAFVLWSTANTDIQISYSEW